LSVFAYPPLARGAEIQTAIGEAVPRVTVIADGMSGEPDPLP
jgi:hypothetical protein